jgi:hypothetical protein
MRALLACGVLLVAARAYADDPQAPAQPPAPAPAPETAPAPESPPPPEPKSDPAYGEKPDPKYAGQTAADPNETGYERSVGRDIYIKSYPDRSHENIIGLSIAAGASVVLGGIGLYYHLDSRDLSNQVSANHFTGEAWSTERQDIYDSANHSALMAGVFYGIGGAVLVGTAIAYMVTEPKMETIVIHPHVNGKPQALVAPTRGGALLGGTWSF